MKTEQSQQLRQQRLASGKIPSSVAEALALGYENQDSDMKTSSDEMSATGTAYFRHPEKPNEKPDLQVPFICTYSYGRLQRSISKRKKEKIMQGSVNVVVR